MKPFLLFSCWPALVASTLALAGCFGSPERCNNCIAFFDGSPPDESSPDVPAATGGTDGSGGMIGTGGASSGGMTGSGGANTGGANTGGANTGGRGTGGASGGAGGANTGGANTGGANTGGANTGGRGTGGASGGAGGAGTGGAGGAAVDPDLVLWYKFDNNVNDSAMFGGMARNGTATSVAYSTGTHQVGTHSLNLSGTATSGGYVTVPNLQTQLPGAVTISCWVNVKGNQNWQRVFDFGTMASTPLIYMFLTTNQAATTPNSVRFSIGTMGNGKEEVINMTTPGTLTTAAWHHLAVVLPAGATYTGTLYIDGVVAGTNTAMTIHPSGIAMPNSFIGRSQWPNDPYFNGYVDDFRIYRRALTAAEITALRAVTQ
jgi:hypothetical protein